MTEINSSDYHDFVIKDGKLLGEFEQMYQKSKEIPWHQDKQEGLLDIDIAIKLLKEYAPFDFICDFGSGMGYYLDILKRNVGKVNCFSLGYDISPTCCKKAKHLFPDTDFRVMDLQKIDHKKIEPEVTGNKLFVIRATLWYVFPKIENVVENIAVKMKKGEILLVTQNFLPLNAEFVGKEIIPDPEALERWFNKYFDPIKTVWYENKLSEGNDNWFVGLFMKK